jgi:hypothetical protein
MAEKSSLDTGAVAEALSKAKLSLDAAVDQVMKRNPDIARAVAARLRALTDNNSTCNTACTCGMPAGIDRVSQ